MAAGAGERTTASPEAGRLSYAIRDSNPEPADLEVRRLRLATPVDSAIAETVNRRLTVNRIPGSHPTAEPSEPVPGRETAVFGRRLWAVS